MSMLLFEHDQHGASAPRVRVSPSDVPAVVVAASQVRRRVQHGMDVIAAMTLCARGGAAPTPLLERAAARAIADLTLLARALEDLERVLHELPSSEAARD